MAANCYVMNLLPTPRNNVSVFCAGVSHSFVKYEDGAMCICRIQQLRECDNSYPPRTMFQIHARLTREGTEK